MAQPIAEPHPISMTGDIFATAIANATHSQLEKPRVASRHDPPSPTKRLWIRAFPSILINRLSKNQLDQSVRQGVT